MSYVLYLINYLCLDAYFKKRLCIFFKVFGCITTQALITTEIIEKTLINTYNVEVFEYISVCHNFKKTKKLKN